MADEPKTRYRMPVFRITRGVYDGHNEAQYIEFDHAFTDAELAAHDAEVAEKARADERERIAAAIEADCEADEPPCYGCWNAARIARTPDPNGDNT